jgi:5-hydroxyisourate hydrolase-like protein (transthyretin family)
MRIRWIMAGPAMLTLAVSLLAGPAGVARAAIVPLTGDDNVVVDTVHGHVFASPEFQDQGSGDPDAVLVADLNGTVVGTITGLSGVQGLALSPDDSMLYAAAPGDEDVVGISTTTFKVTKTYRLPVAYSPQELAVEDGKLWVSYYASVPGITAGIGDIDLTAANPVFSPGTLSGDYYYAPKLVADPLGHGTLVAEYTGISPWDGVGVYDVATTPPTTYLQGTQLASCPENSDIAVLPGGSEFVVAGCSDSFNEGTDTDPGLQVFSTSTLQHVATWYGGYGTPRSVSVAANGLVAVGNAANTGPDLYTFKPGATTPQDTYSLQTELPPGSSEFFTLVDGGLAFAPDGSVLTAVTGGLTQTGQAFILYILPSPGVSGTTLSLGGTTSAALGKTVSLTGRLAYTVGSPAAGTKVAIVRSLAGSSATKMVTVSTAAGGAFRLTDIPAAAGAYTYTARYAGNSTHEAVTTVRTVSILRDPVTLTLEESRGTAGYHQPVTLTAHLGATYANRDVSIYAQPYGTTTRRLIKSGRVSASGNLSVGYAPATDTTFSAVFAGDARYAPKTVTTHVGVRAAVSQSDRGWYSSASYGGVLYRVFHQGGSLNATAMVAPNKKGECVAFQLEQHRQGQWVSKTGPCLSLNGSSEAAWQLRLSGKAGDRFRLRVNFVHTDKANLASDSSWYYFAVTR